MKSRSITFRCPEELLEQVDILAEARQVSRTAVLVEAARIFAKHLRRRGGVLVPPYTDDDLLEKLHFEESRGRHAANADQEAED